MARKKIEFRPDPTGYDVAGKLHLTRQQRQSLLKWVLYSVVCVAGLVLQDSMLAGFRLFDGRFEVAPALIILICVLEGCDSGALFALLGAMIYVFSGTGPGHWGILVLTLSAVLAAAFRQSYLRRGIGSDLICVGGAMVLYELCVFCMGLFLQLTYAGRWKSFAVTALVSTLTAGTLYRPLKHIGTIGGNEWKE